jgi:hypothetical protein
VTLEHAFAGPVHFGSSVSGDGQRQAFFDMLQRHVASPKPSHHLISAQLANFVLNAAARLLQPSMFRVLSAPPEQVVVEVRHSCPFSELALTNLAFVGLLLTATV